MSGGDPFHLISNIRRAPLAKLCPIDRARSSICAELTTTEAPAIAKNARNSAALFFLRDLDTALNLDEISVGERDGVEVGDGGLEADHGLRVTLPLRQKQSGFTQESAPWTLSLSDDDRVPEAGFDERTRLYTWPISSDDRMGSCASRSDLSDNRVTPWSLRSRCAEANNVRFADSVNNIFVGLEVAVIEPVLLDAREVARVRVEVAARQRFPDGVDAIAREPKRL